ncbi:MAG: hypothetical protein GX862_03685 [Leucobacter sp.]|jgi:phosphoglycolate phosphatase-like HAD superfamily hydrolase|nr:hypothetical protein [Leucobacter sp.]
MNNNITPLRTPYHALSTSGTPVVPTWARNRSVYRAAGRTLYLVETDSLEHAKNDLDQLARSGWDVQISSTAPSSASIALSRSAA